MTDIHCRVAIVTSRSRNIGRTVSLPGPNHFTFRIVGDHVARMTMGA